MSALDRIHKKEREDKELTAIEWCIYWADLTDTDKESTVPEEAAAELEAMTKELDKLVRFLINGGYIKTDDMHDTDASQAAIDVIRRYERAFAIAKGEAPKGGEA
jgi:hypothetical protein